MTDPAADERLELRADDIAWQELDGQVVVLDTAGGSYLLLNASAAHLWHTVSGGATRGELAGSLVDRYGIDPGRAEADVDAFLRTLADRSLLKR